jgi:hypothetical protein
MPSEAEPYTVGSPSLLKYSMFEIENCYSVPLLAKERGPDLPPEPPSPKEVGANLQPIVAFRWIANWLPAPKARSI